MKTIKDISYMEDKAIVVYEEDGVISMYELSRKDAGWKGSSEELDKFFAPLLKKGE